MTFGPKRLAMVNQPTFHITCTDNGDSDEFAGQRFLWQTWIAGTPIQELNCPASIGFQDGLQSYLIYLAMHDQLARFPLIKAWIEAQNLVRDPSPIVCCCPCLSLNVYSDVYMSLYERQFLSNPSLKPFLFPTFGGGSNLNLTLTPTVFNLLAFNVIVYRTDTIILTAHEGCPHIQNTSKQKGVLLRNLEVNAKRLYPFMERLARPLKKVVLAYLQQIEGQLGYITIEYLPN